MNDTQNTFIKNRNTMKKIILIILICTIFFNLISGQQYFIITCFVEDIYTTKLDSNFVFNKIQPIYDIIKKEKNKKYPNHNIIISNLDSLEEVVEEFQLTNYEQIKKTILNRYFEKDLVYNQIKNFKKKFKSNVVVPKINYISKSELDSLTNVLKETIKKYTLIRLKKISKNGITKDELERLTETILDSLIEHKIEEIIKYTKILFDEKKNEKKEKKKKSISVLKEKIESHLKIQIKILKRNGSFIDTILCYNNTKKEYILNHHKKDTINQIGFYIDSTEILKKEYFKFYILNNKSDTIFVKNFSHKNYFFFREKKNIKLKKNYCYYDLSKTLKKGRYSINIDIKAKHNNYTNFFFKKFRYE